jgi:hypothetical protein
VHLAGPGRVDALTTHPLADGRTLIAEPMPNGDWHLRIEGEPGAEIIGWPLNSTLADLLGYAVAHEDWPTWVDDLARQIDSEHPMGHS